jgi:hypothetical protein
LRGTAAFAAGETRVPVFAPYGRRLRAANFDCVRDRNGFFTCLTSSKIDLSEAILLQGGGPASIDAHDRYRAAMILARRKSLGFWSD